MTDKSRIKTFVDGFFDSFQTLPDGTRGVHTDALTALVRSDPDTAALVIRGFGDRGKEDPAYYQYALALAGAYAVVEGDRSLLELVRQAMEQAGRVPRLPTLRPDEPPARAKPSIVEIDVPSLQTCDILPLVREFSLADAPDRAPAQLRRHWGTMILSFKLDDDPREVWLIPEARRFVQTLHAAMPYFPGCLALHSVFRQMPIYFGCLAPLEAMLADGFVMNAAHESVLAAARAVLTAIGQVAAQLGLDPAPACGAVLALYPEEAARELFPEWANA
jgi:hypothetical protein